MEENIYTNPQEIFDLSDTTDAIDVPEFTPVEKSTVTESVRSSSECQICFEVYNTGAKRCMVTKCGHLFCDECLSSLRYHNNVCPTCRRPLGKKRDLRAIYDANIVMVDTSSVDAAKKETDMERVKRIKVC